MADNEKTHPEGEPQERFSKKVDEDWKKAARKEKDKLVAEDKAHAAEIDEETNQLFLSFVSQLVGEVQMLLGIMEHPMTGQREYHPEQAKFMIDVLRAMDKKTKPTQTPQEKQFFAETLPKLQMIFVQMQQAMAGRGGRGGGKETGGGAKGGGGQAAPKS